MRSTTLIRLALGVALVPALTASAQPAPEDWRVEREERTWEVSGTADIRLSNPWGNLAVRAHKKPEIYLIANWQHHKDDLRDLQLAVERSGDKVELQVGFAALDLETVPSDWTLRRADITLLVPEHAVTRFSTGKGTLEVRGTRGHTTVETGGGDIRLRIFGTAAATTEHGSVFAHLRRTDWQRPIEISTITGAIRVEMPQGGVPRATLETRGEITSDYSMEVERVEGSRLKRSRLTTTAADSSRGTLQLTSYSGPIAVVETMVSEETDGGRH